MRIGDLAGAVGKGLAAGVVGTAAMTLSSSIEAKLRGRAPSTAPADAASKVLGVKPESDEDQARFTTLVHWGYGTGWGAVHGVLAGIGLPPRAATAGHFAAVFGSGLVLLPKLEVAPPVPEWGATEIAVDAFHHTVYALATGLAYRLLEAASTPPAHG